MTLLDLTTDELLSTTRTVRKRLDLTRPVEPEVIDACLDLAFQAPSGSNSQGWHFIVVTDADQRRALGDIYRRGFQHYAASGSPSRYMTDEGRRILDSAVYLSEHMGEVPVLLVPCIEGRTDGAQIEGQAGRWGSILPAAWSFMLAARSRGLGTAWTTLHLHYEREAADLLGIPFDKVMQAALIPVAYTLGTDFRRGPRVPKEKLVHHDRW
ncbi:MAG TPA: nitroreductase family protein [Candidatus Dormibacteraeota bacterium]|jgi:nitroreductase|nr:nitroreductase family protein [Candidatus Dormibacteraeota bacterium]